MLVIKTRLHDKKRSSAKPASVTIHGLMQYQDYQTMKIPTATRFNSRLARTNTKSKFNAAGAGTRARFFSETQANASDGRNPRNKYQVTRRNFWKALAELREVLKEAHFVAIDAEMTGICSGRWRQSSSRDTVQVRYLKLRHSASNFSIVQFGICPFRWDPASRAFFAHPYNFYIFPGNDLSHDNTSSEFLCQASSLEFLARHQFDFNTWVYEGIPQISIAKGNLSHQSKLRDMPCSRLQKIGLNVTEKPISSIVDTLVVERTKLKIGLWRDSILKIYKNGSQNSLHGENNHSIKAIDSDASFFKMRPSLLLNGLNPHRVKLVQQVISEDFSDLVYMEQIGSGGIVKKQVVYTSSEEDKSLLLNEIEEDHCLSLESHLEEGIGFDHVIDLIASCRRVLVGHNCLLDFTHLHSKFIGPLPENVVEFAASLHKNFPFILDTKHLMKAVPTLKYLMKNRKTSLSSCFARICRERVCIQNLLGDKVIDQDGNIILPIELQRYTDENCSTKHEAGYDAFMAGSIFAQVCYRLDIDFSQFQFPSDAATCDKLKSHLNRFNLACMDCLVFDAATGVEMKPADTRNIVLLWGFQHGCSFNEAQRLVSCVLDTTSCIRGFFVVDETSAFIEFENEKTANQFIQLLQRMSGDSKTVSTVTPRYQGIMAAGYEIYEEACRADISKPLLAEQVEALRITRQRCQV